VPVGVLERAGVGIAVLPAELRGEPCECPAFDLRRERRGEQLLGEVVGHAVTSFGVQRLRERASLRGRSVVAQDAIPVEADQDRFETPRVAEHQMVTVKAANMTLAQPDGFRGAALDPAPCERQCPMREAGCRVEPPQDGLLEQAAEFLE
jgi:hypothetical protein